MNVLDRVKQYAGLHFNKCRLGNPAISKREAIELANYIAFLEKSLDLSDSNELPYSDKKSTAEEIIEDFKNYMEMKCWSCGHSDFNQKTILKNKFALTKTFCKKCNAIVDRKIEQFF